MRQEAHYKIQHKAHGLRGSACYNCLNMCVSHHGRKIPIDEYWCERQHGFVKQPPKTCEKRREAS